MNWYGLPDEYTRHFGYHTKAGESVPEHDPGLEVGCPYCSEPLTPDNVRTVSFAAPHGAVSYFYCLHRACDDRHHADQKAPGFEERLIAAIPADDWGPKVY